MANNVDFTKMYKDRRTLPPDKVFKHTFPGGAVNYTAGNKFIQVTIDSINKSEPLEVVEFDADLDSLIQIVNAKDPSRLKLRAVRSKVKGQRDRLTLDR